MILENLDPGIRDLVEALDRDGFQTTDSGDGVSKGAEGLRYRHVFIQVSRETSQQGLYLSAQLAKRALEICFQVTGQKWLAQISGEISMCDNIFSSGPILLLLAEEKSYYSDSQ